MRNSCFFAPTLPHPPAEGTFRVRDATAADGPALLALTRETPMQADISLQIEREPDFFALSRARGRPRLVVAEAEGRVVACAGAMRRPGRIAPDHVAEIGMIADLKVHPAWRRKGVAGALLEALARAEASEPPAVFIAESAVGNVAVDAVARAFATPRGLRALGTITTRQLLPLLPSKAPPPGLRLRPATPTDRPALLELLEGFHARYALAPSFAGEAFDELLARSPGMALESYRLAERDGKLVAACAVWDTDALKRTRVIAMPATLRAVAWLTRRLPIPGLPPPGELLRFRYVRHPSHLPGEEAALAALLRDAVVEARVRGEHFLLYTCADNDPLARVVAGWPSTTYLYRVVAGVNRPEALPALDALAGRLCFDDAALA